MKFLTLTTVLLALGLNAQATSQNPSDQTGYSTNTGKSAPGTFSSPGGRAAKSPMTTTENKTTSTSAVLDTTNPNSEANAAKTDEMNTGISPSDMNTAPTDTPIEAQESDTFGTTLSTGDQVQKPYKDGTFAPDRDESEKQAQEDRTLDYSTSPNRKPLEDNEEEEQE